MNYTRAVSLISTRGGDRSSIRRVVRSFAELLEGVTRPDCCGATLQVASLDVHCHAAIRGGEQIELACKLGILRTQQRFPRFRGTLVEVLRLLIPLLFPIELRKVEQRLRQQRTWAGGAV